MADSPSTAITASEDILRSLGTTLLKEASGDPLPEHCLDIITSLEKETGTKKKAKTPATTTNQSNMTKALLESTSIGTTLTKSIRSFKRHKRTSSDQPAWNEVIQRADALLSAWNHAATAAAKRQTSSSSTLANTPADVGKPNTLPQSATQYRARLLKYKAELYKDPPVLPPPSIIIELTNAGLPKRNSKSGELTFPPGQDSDETNALLKDFHPNRTPQEVLEAGAFGGTYFRQIGSSVTNTFYKSSEVLKETLHEDWMENLNTKQMLTSSTYKVGVNKYGVKCGGSLGMWESSGWIADCDPYGWFQWYCRFYQGRRCSDDPRQISRWNKSAGIKGRFRSQ